jgi:hypothetical protein
MQLRFDLDLFCTYLQQFSVHCDIVLSSVDMQGIRFNNVSGHRNLFHPVVCCCISRAIVIRPSFQGIKPSDLCVVIVTGVMLNQYSIVATRTIIFEKHGSPAQNLVVLPHKEVQCANIRSSEGLPSVKTWSSFPRYGGLGRWDDL